ncbi:unnamed protein product [Vicia faba]|uniref:Uncharacterized protein n=1 Tax=Vicia faba TaxID=3906 RepID=A0AAV0ZXI7_VICFA|nr:unnamed protein product [Vicia faba]
MFILTTKLKRLKEKLKTWNKEICGNVHEQVTKEKAKADWHKDGDKNTTYFHRFAKIRHTTKAISSLLLTDNKDTTYHITIYFENLFSSNGGLVQDQRFVDDVIPNLVYEVSNVMLTMLPSSLEIKKYCFFLEQRWSTWP